MNELDYLIFVNEAKKPVAGFAYKDDATSWVISKRWGRHWRVEIRKAGESMCVFVADARGFIGGKED